MKEVKEDLVVLFSGGADSVLLMEFADDMDRKPLAVLINYGQLHVQELDYAMRYCEEKNIPYQVVELVNYTVKSGLTTGEKGIYKGVHEMNVPARNSIMISIAAGIAESNGIKEVWIGCDFSDREHLFPDCFQEYIFNMGKVFEIAFSYPIKLYAPLLGFTKEMVLKQLESYGIKEDKLYTGYREFGN
jgi:7-cyano-7-deazaguanine synthase